MKTKELLEKAAGVLEKRGWCRNTLEDGNGRVCAVGAILTAQTGDPNTYGREDDRPQRWTAYRRILKALGLEVESERAECAVVDWNNEDCKSKVEIVRVFRKAAALKS